VPGSDRERRSVSVSVSVVEEQDPLGVRAATAWVVERAADVSVVPEAAVAVAAQIAADLLPLPRWRTPPHWWSDADPAATATYVLLVDALNFSFWGEPKWRLRWHGETVDGYFALAAAVTSAIERGVPLTEPAYLAGEACAAALLAGADDTPIPLLPARQAAIEEVGRGLLADCGGSSPGWVTDAGRSAASLVRGVVGRFPSFRDVTSYQGRPVPFYKRAQLLVSDLHGAFAGAGPGAFRDLRRLTMFADYKVPQVLHGLGVLRYSARLEAALRAYELMPFGDPREVEIRAGSVQAVELIADVLAARGLEVPAYDVDWRLWSLGQGRAWPLPYHRTRSVYY